MLFQCKHTFKMCYKILASDILCFQETKQKKYQRPPQSRFSSISCYAGCGLSIWYGPLVRLIKKFDATLPGIEILGAAFQTSFGTKVQVVGIYKSSKSSTPLFIELLQHQISILDPQSSSFLVGDFNIDILPNSPPFRQLSEMLSARGYHQLVNTPTTIYNSSLDHIWARTNNDALLYGTNYIYWSDHSSSYILLPHHSP